MNRPSTLQAFSQELCISYSQISTYLNCPLRYRFQYVENRPQERISISLPFGAAVHMAIALFYRNLKNHGQLEPLESLYQRFEDCLEVDLDSKEIPIIYKKDMPNRHKALQMGKDMLKCFYETVDLTGYEIVGVELPLSATLYTEDGKATDFKLIGILDLVLRDEKGEILVVDSKTAVKPIAQNTADDDLQMSAYAYLLASNKYVFPTASVKCQFQVLRKLAEPKLEYVETTRTAAHRKRFTKIANSVLAAIDSQIYFTHASWMCADCPYSEACKSW